MALLYRGTYEDCQKQVSQAGISNYTPQFTVGCNYLSLPEIPASGNEVHICPYTLPSIKSVNQFHKSYNAPVPYRTMHHTELRCAYFYSECALWDMGQVHCGIQTVCIFLTERNRALGSCCEYLYIVSTVFCHCLWMTFLWSSTTPT